MRGRTSGRMSPTLITAIATVVVGAIHLWLARGIVGPTIALDEAGYIGNARWLAGDPNVFAMPLSPYYGFGYSLFLVPLHLVANDPTTLWRGTMVINAILLASLVPLLATFVRRMFGASPSVALPAAVVGALIPASLGGGITAQSESLALPAVVAAAVACHAMVAPGPLRSRIWFGPAVALLYASHARFTPVVVVAVVALGIAGLRGLVPRVVTAANAAALVVLTGATVVLNRVLIDARWIQTFAPEGDLSDTVGLLTDAGGVARLVRSTVGQSWYVAVGAAGISVMGIILLLLVAFGGHPAVLDTDGRGEAPTGPDEPDASATATRFTAAMIVIAAIGVFAASVLFFSQNSHRSDHLVFGRHNDTFTPLWVAAGVTLLLVTRARSTLLRRFAVALAVGAALSVVLVLVQNPQRHGNTYLVMAVPALTRYADDPFSGVYLRATVGFVLTLGLVAALAMAPRRWRVVALVPLVATFAWMGTGYLDEIEGTNDYVYGGWELPDQVRRLGIERAALVGTTSGGHIAMRYQAALPDVRFDLWEPGTPLPRQPMVFAPLGDPTLRESPARVALLDAGRFFLSTQVPDGMALWVQPGAEQDRLDRAGRLLPPGYPTDLPPPARRSDVRVLAPTDGGVRVASGSPVTMRVEITNRGNGSPWIDAESARPRRIQLGVRLVDARTGEVRSATSSAELPAMLYPGDDGRLSVQVQTVDPFLGELAPGRYRAEFGIMQVDSSWFAPSADQPDVTVEVTG